MSRRTDISAITSYLAEGLQNDLYRSQENTYRFRSSGFEERNSSCFNVVGPTSDRGAPAC